MTVRTISEAGQLTLDPRGTGRMLVKIINVGVGSSAEYTAEALQEAAARRVFGAGTHMYLDHAGPEKRGPHGERSIRDLASVLTTDAYYDDTEQSLIAEVQAIDGYETILEGLAKHVGVSISATAEVDPPRKPGGKPVVRSFLVAESVDWVVKAGRGGAVLAILESAGVAEATVNDRREQIDRAVRDMWRDPDRDVWASLADFDETTQTAYFHAGNSLWAQTYEPTPDDLSVSLTGDRLEVRAVTTYVPAISAGVTEKTLNPEEGHMPTIDQAELERLLAQASQVEAATKRAEEAEQRVKQAEADKALTEARKLAASKVAEATKDLPDQVTARISHTIEAGITEGLPADIDAQIVSAVEAERAYLASVNESTRLTGFGQVTESAPAKRTRNAFGRKIQEV